MMPLLPSAHLPLPNFLVIGAQKSGTTWLYYYLKSSRNVFVPLEQKELAFFDNLARFQKLGEEQYREYFSGWNGEAAIGEVTPGYIWTSLHYKHWGAPIESRASTPKRVRDVLGSDVKIVALLRNPIDRAHSAFIHHRKKGRIKPTEMLKDVWMRHGIIHMGFYAAHLREWASVFSKQNFWIRPYEAFFSNREHLISLLDFLGAEPSDQDILNKRIHRGAGFTRTPEAIIDASGDAISTAKEIEILRSVYRQDVLELEHEWSLDLSCWASDF
jgi:hypothetical protein